PPKLRQGPQLGDRASQKSWETPRRVRIGRGPRVTGWRGLERATTAATGTNRWLSAAPGSGPGEAARGGFEAVHAFLDAGFGGGVAEADVAGHAEAGAGNDADAVLVEEDF